MKREAKEISDDEWTKSLGELNEADFAALREGLAGEPVDLESDAKVDRLMKSVGSGGKVSEEDAPPLPDSIRDMFEAQKNETLESLAAEEDSLESSIYSRPRRYHPEKEKKSLFSILFGPVGLAVVGAAAAVCIGLFVILREKPASPVDTLAATTASMLTPGDVTGFTEPVFTWNTDNGGSVDIEIIETSTGRVVGSLKQVFSPLRFSSLAGEKSLSGDGTYEVRILNGDKALASRTFKTQNARDGAPSPSDNLDEIIRSCEELIAANRPADAWMLWGELTADQKKDPRMAELKEKILGAIAA